MASSARPRPKQKDRSATSVAPRAFSPSRSRNQVVWLDGSSLDCRGAGLVWGERVVSRPESPDDHVRDLGGAPPPRRMRDAGGDARCPAEPGSPHGELGAMPAFSLLPGPSVDDWRSILQIWAVAKGYSRTNPMRPLWSCGTRCLNMTHGRCICWQSPGPIIVPNPAATGRFSGPPCVV